MTKYERHAVNLIVAYSSAIMFVYVCHAIRASLAVVNSCSTIWADTKILTLLCSFQLILTRVRPLVTLLWYGWPQKRQSRPLLDYFIDDHWQQVAQSFPKSPHIVTQTLLQKSSNSRTRACPSLQAISYEYYHKARPFYCHTNPPSSELLFLSVLNG